MDLWHVAMLDEEEFINYKLKSIPNTEAVSTSYSNPQPQHTHESMLVTSEM